MAHNPFLQSKPTITAASGIPAMIHGELHLLVDNEQIDLLVVFLSQSVKDNWQLRMSPESNICVVPLRNVKRQGIGAAVPERPEAQS